MSLGIAATDDWNGLTAEELIHEADVAQKKLDARSVLALPFRLQDSVSFDRKQTPIPAA